MSLARTALRIAAVAALNSHPAIDARCAGRVYDSRIGDFDHDELVPVIVVTTEELHGDAVSQQNGGTPFFDECDLVLEIAMTQLVSQDGQELIVRSGTDSGMEADLDFIEWCAEQILTTGKTDPRAARPTPAGRVLTQAVMRRVKRRTSSRFASDDTGQKLAIHLLTFRVELKGETPDVLNLPTGPFASLPDPLRTVAESLPVGSPAYLICQTMAAGLIASAPTMLQLAAINPAGTGTPVPNNSVPSLTIPLAETP